MTVTKLERSRFGRRLSLRRRLRRGVVARLRQGCFYLQQGKDGRKRYTSVIRLLRSANVSQAI